MNLRYVKSELYEKAIHFFERASQIQPKEVKWRLMVTSCYRRMGNYQRALELYEKVHAEHPENVECLRYLVAICKDLGHPHDQYQAKLSRLDRNASATMNTNVPQGQLTRAAPQPTATAPSAASSRNNADAPAPKFDPAPHDPGPMAAPKARGVVNTDPERPRTAVKRDAQEEDFEDADVEDLLP